MSLKDLNVQEQHIVYSRDVLHAHSKAVQKILDLELRYIEDCEAMYKEGKNVIFASGMQGSPLVYACDAIPLCNMEISRLASPNAVKISEDYFQVPRDVCSMAKTLLGEYYLRKDFTVKRVLQTTHCCEPINMTMQLIRDFGYDVHMMDYGYKYDNISEERFQVFLKHVANEQLKTARWINGKELDEQKLLYEMKRYNRIVETIHRIMTLRLQHNVYMLSLPTLFMLMGIGNFYGKPDEFEAAVNLLEQELLALKPGEYHKERIPIIWHGGRGMEFGVYEAVDNSGGYLAAFSINNCYTRVFDVSLPPLEAFVRFQVGGRYSESSNPVCREIERAIEESGARGIISYGFNGCSFAGISAELIREYFKKRNVPMIIVDGSYQVGEPSGQVVTRIRAFMEMLA